MFILCKFYLDFYLQIIKTYSGNLGHRLGSMKKNRKSMIKPFFKNVKINLESLKNTTNKVGMMITIINVIVIITLLTAITDQKHILEKDCRVSDNFQLKWEKQCVVKWDGEMCKRWPWPVLKIFGQPELLWKQAKEFILRKQEQKLNRETAYAI